MAKTFLESQKIRDSLLPDQFRGFVRCAAFKIVPARAIEGCSDGRVLGGFLRRGSNDAG
ncbi:MAG: hypothetical protein CM1200mP41_10120 [Gammaproteobacteria bacterium]|nr:MAG: hypothetical protein CM1200mP41_10120 [Gammaproteobacteria bacterium]